jgi:hypothetical protein
MTDYTNPARIATAEQFKTALLAIRDKSSISPRQLGMLRAHCRAPDHTITAAQLADAVRLSSFGVANLQYGKFAHAVADQLGFESNKRPNGTTRWWFTLAVGREGTEETEDGRFEWVMRPELVKALQAMKWA